MFDLIFSTLLFLLTNLVLAWSFEAHLQIPKISTTKVAVLFLINASIYALIQGFATGIYIESLSIIVLFCGILSQIILLRTTNRIIAIMLSLTLTLILTGIRLSVSTAIALMDDMTIAEFMASAENRYFVANFTLILTSIIGLIFKNTVTTSTLTRMLANKKNIEFVIVIQATIFGYLVLTMDTVHIKSNAYEITIVQLKVALCVLAGVILSYAFAYMFANAKAYSQKLDGMRTILTREQSEIEKLDYESKLDGFTKLSRRSVAIAEIQKHIDRKVPFYVIYIDLDGLKKINDEYSYSEGDFYIKKSAEVVLNCFKDSAVARLGGDEILVVGETVSEFDVNDTIIFCYDEIDNISKTYDKPYETSMSYGVFFVDAETHTDPEKIIKVADAKMYEHKSQRKKQR